jgi:hypothetical protein
MMDDGFNDHECFGVREFSLERIWCLFFFGIGVCLDVCMYVFSTE